MSKKNVLITGSSKGIGAGIAKLFSSREYRAIVTYNHDEAGAERICSDIIEAGGEAVYHALDVRKEQSVVELADYIRKAFGVVDVLVSNATTEIPKPIDDASLGEWHEVLLTKLDGAFLITKHFIELLSKSSNPSIIYITSLDGERPSGDYIAYQVGTAGLIAMTKANSVYLAKKYGIRVNAVSPGPVKTGLWEKAGQTDEMWADFAQSSPVGRVATVKDVAEACYFLASDPGKLLNGVFIDVDGGDRWT